MLKQENYIRHKIAALLVIILVLCSICGFLKYRAPKKESATTTIISLSPTEENQLESAVIMSENTNQQPLSSMEFERLFPGWMMLKQEALSIQTGSYCIVVMARYHDEFNNSIRISICKNTSDQWKQVWRTPRDLKCQGFNSDDLRKYPESYTPDVIITTDTHKALVAANIFKGGQGWTQVIAFVLDDRGKGIVKLEDSSGPMSIDIEGNKIRVQGEGETVSYFV